MTVEVRLKEIRNGRGISQNELARRLEMSLANVQKIEYGKAKSIPLDTLDKLCKILQCEVGQLLVRIPDDDEGNSELAKSMITETPVPNVSKNTPSQKTKLIEEKGKLKSPLQLLSSESAA
ncbi:helix-turn-helix transcriptional regulator [Nostoc sphaeroides CHAB 2801]|uniref:helix-turn-helix domain-containing protein n=1 Tax=Nostoc sphaeroides TaxID=446679 RepID=UPI001E449241|nr:helix-turn-helix transcriptional regulator [Nostoc sphaeroides]MCC5633637.1 helix-turn-helix transcriptional regulator [Nostoc sphaeroides CHAB 2801]